MDINNEQKNYRSYIRTFCGSFLDPEHPLDSRMFNKSDSPLPPTNVVETKDEYLLEIALPGYRKENIEIKVENDVLMLKGECRAENLPTIKKFFRKEFSNESFEFSLLLPENVQDDAIEAEYINGLLCIHVPKSEEPVLATKRIRIQ